MSPNVRTCPRTPRTWPGWKKVPERASAPDGSLLASGKRPDNDTYTVTVKTDLRGITAFRIELLPDKSLPQGGPGLAVYLVLLNLPYGIVTALIAGAVIGEVP